MPIKPITASLVALPVAAIVAAGAAAPLYVGSASGDVAQAEQTTAALAGALVSAVASISDATPHDATPEQIAAGSAAISMLFAECQRDFRLIDASGDPLDSKNLPQGSFEVDALAELVSNGGGSVQEVINGRLRTVVALTNDMHMNCVSCHTNYGEFEPGSVIGAASFMVKIR